MLAFAQQNGTVDKAKHFAAQLHAEETGAAVTEGDDGAFTGLVDLYEAGPGEYAIPASAPFPASTYSMFDNADTFMQPSCLDTLEFDPLGAPPVRACVIACRPCLLCSHPCAAPLPDGHGSYFECAISASTSACAAADLALQLMAPSSRRREGLHCRPLCPPLPLLFKRKRTHMRTCSCIKSAAAA